MRNEKLYRLSLTALFIALNCASTVIIQIPSPMNGYVNLGDCFVLLSGWLLGPFYGFIAGGLGSCLADIVTGYTHYAVGTFFIKGIMAIIAALVFKAFSKLMPKLPRVSRILSGVVAEIFMVTGYLGYAALLLGRGVAALASVPGNLIQAAVGIAGSVILFEAITKLKLIKNTYR